MALRDIRTYMDPSRFARLINRRETKIIAPIYPACLWKTVCFLALMDICAPSPHHPYGLVKPMRETGFKGAGLTNLNIKSKCLRNRMNGFRLLTYFYSFQQRHGALHRRPVRLAFGQDHPGDAGQLVGHRHARTVMAAPRMHGIRPATEAILLGRRVA